MNGIDIDKIIPTKKDYERADSLQFNGRIFYGSGAPFKSCASRMAKLIKDKNKLVARTKAVVDRWGTRDYYGYCSGEPQKENVWIPFAEALERSGFTHNEITQISKYQKD